MRTITYAQAIVEAQAEELRRDEQVFLIGKDVRSDLYGTATGLYETFGERIVDAPSAESGMLGAGFGAALVGMHPIIDAGNCGQIYYAYDQIISNAAKSRYMYGGQCTMGATIRTQMAYGLGEPAEGAERNYPMFMHTPGIKIAVPSTPYDMKGMLKAAIRDQNLCMIYETELLRSTTGEVPDEDYVVAFGKAAVRREGTDVTLIGIGSEVAVCLGAAELLAEEGISCEVIDPRSLVPLDVETIATSARKTGRVLIDDPTCLTCSAASEISAVIAETAFDALKAPVLRICAPDSPVPMGRQADGFWATKEQVAQKVREILKP